MSTDDLLKTLQTATPERALQLLDDPRVLAAIGARVAPGSAIVLADLDRILEVTASGLVLVHCMKCEMSRLARLPPANYQHQFTKPFKIMEWDNARAWQLVKASGRAPMPIGRAWVKEWIERRANLTPGHIDHIPPERRRDPVLCDMVYVKARRHDTGQLIEVEFPMLIDGHHRAALSVRDGWQLTGYALTADEQRQVVSVRVDEYDPQLMGWLSREQAEAQADELWDAV